MKNDVSLLRWQKKIETTCIWKKFKIFGKTFWPNIFFLPNRFLDKKIFGRKFLTKKGSYRLVSESWQNHSSAHDTLIASQSAHFINSHSWFSIFPNIFFLLFQRFLIFFQIFYFFFNFRLFSNIFIFLIFNFFSNFWLGKYVWFSFMILSHFSVWDTYCKQDFYYFFCFIKLKIFMNTLLFVIMELS